MKKIITLAFVALGFNLAVSQELSDAEKRQAKVYAEGIRMEKAQAKKDKAAAKKFPLAAEKEVADTLVDIKHFNNGKRRLGYVYGEKINGPKNNRIYENLEHISFEVKDGIMMAKFRADLLSQIEEKLIIKNYEVVPNDTARVIKPGNDKIFVYVTPATPGKYFSTTKYGYSFGVLTVPFKIRPSTGSVPSESKADIKNINIFIGRNRLTERMFWNQRTSSHRWMLGVMAGISSEELTNLNTDDPSLEDKPVNQAYLTAAVGLGYSYKDKLTLMFIPAGVDHGFSDTSKKWIYNGNYWWGFGIGLDISGIFHI